MMINCESGNLSHEVTYSVTLVPRMQYSVNLLHKIIDLLSEKRDVLRKSNKFLLHDFDESDDTQIKSLKLEYRQVLSLEILYLIEKRTSHISRIDNIPEILPSVIPLLRIVSAQLFDVFPDCSHMLSELSVHVGSIVMDSAVLTSARFDFCQSNYESATLLDEVKLMAGSKLCKQYPNLDFPKLFDT